MRTECWIKGDEIVIATIYDNGKVNAGCFTWHDYPSFVTDMAMYGYVLES